MQIEWRRIWKVLLGCCAPPFRYRPCFARGQLGWGLTALEAVVKAVARISSINYAHAVWKTWWFVN